MSASNPPHNMGEGIDIILDVVEDYYHASKELLNSLSYPNACQDRIDFQMQRTHYFCNLTSYYIQQSCTHLDSIEQYSLNTCEIDVVADEYPNPTSSTLPLKIQPLSSGNYQNQDVHLPIASHDASLTALDKLQRTEDNHAREDILNTVMHDFLAAALEPID